MARFLKSASLIIIATSIWACNPPESSTSASDEAAKSTSSAIASETVPSTVKDKMKRKNFRYDTDGKTDEDHLYLEEVLGEAALSEVKSWNARSLARLESDPRFEAMQAEALSILNSKDKIPYVSYQKGKVQNFWQDADHVRGIWRRASLESYLSEDTDWETVIDFDALSKAEDANWVYKGRTCLPPENTRCMISLSDGGKDAVVRREFDAATKTWIKDGFNVDESKGAAVWLNKNQLLIGVDLGEGSLTDSGYPMVTKLWTRGTPLSSAKELMRGEPEDVGLWPATLEVAPGQYEIILVRSVTFYETEYFWLPREGEEISSPVRMPIPEKSSLGGRFKSQVLLSLQENWRGFKSGDLVSFDPKDFMNDGDISKIDLVFSPNEKQSLNGYGITKSKVLMSISEDVSSRADSFDWDGETWTSDTVSYTHLTLPTTPYV